MSVNKTLLALGVLVAIMLVGCREPVGLPNNDVKAATTQTVYCYVEDESWPTGHIDWYQGQSSIWDFYVWDYQDPTITRAFYYYPLPISPPRPDTNRAYPRKNGYCVFSIPPFDCPSQVPACTLYYHQVSHSGTPDLLVNAWHPDAWPPSGANSQTCFWRIWDSADTVATDSTRTNDGCWYTAPLSDWACEVIADSGAWYYENDPDGKALFYTGWVIPSYAANHGCDSSYTDVSGGTGDYAPYIKVVYEE